MKVKSYRQAEGREEVPGVTMRVVAGPEDGAPNFAMRLFEVGPGASTPYHSHPWEHEVFVISGSGQVRGTAGTRQLGEGDAVFVAPGEEHCFASAGGGTMRMICVVPLVNGAMPRTSE
ncbi:MAG: cupin domain-containing protein [Chloroflexota bacterium]|nr:cupin domain-containing protein [Chloroflexota bacterium]